MSHSSFSSVQKKTPIFVFLRKKYRPIEVKNSDNITDGMVRLKCENNLSVR